MILRVEVVRYFAHEVRYFVHCKRKQIEGAHKAENTLTNLHTKR